MMKQNHTITGQFTGTIDELLEHCATIDLDSVDVADAETIAQIQEFMKDNNMSEPEFLEFVKNQMIQQELDALLAEGKVQIVGHDEDGNPLYKSVD